MSTLESNTDTSIPQFECKDVGSALPEHSTPKPPVTHSFGDTAISASYDRPVVVTVGIVGRLPNRIFTLRFPLMVAILSRVDMNPYKKQSLPALCRKFYMAQQDFNRSGRVFVEKSGKQETVIVLNDGKLYATGNNKKGQCGTGNYARGKPQRSGNAQRRPRVPTPTFIRLPPVLDVWLSSAGSWWAKTTHGLYAWGNDKKGQLGVNADDDDFMSDGIVPLPTKVALDADVTDIAAFQTATFLRTAAGWYACGDDQSGQLGLRRRLGGARFLPSLIRRPTLIEGSVNIVRWVSGSSKTFAWTATGNVLVCGCDSSGQLGLGAANAAREPAIDILTRYPFPISGIASMGALTVFLSGGRLLGAGCNAYHQLGPNDDEDGPRMIADPVELTLPGRVTKVVVPNSYQVYIRLTDGRWMGRGEYLSEMYGHPRDHPEPGAPGRWRPVLETERAVLDAAEPPMAMDVTTE